MSYQSRLAGQDVGLRVGVDGHGQRPLLISAAIVDGDGHVVQAVGMTCSNGNGEGLLCHVLCYLADGGGTRGFRCADEVVLTLVAAQVVVNSHVLAFACEDGYLLRVNRHREVVVLLAVGFELPDAERAVHVRTQTDVACLDGSDVVALDGNLLVAGRAVIDDGLPVRTVLRELDGVEVYLVNTRLGACVAVVDDEAVHAVCAFAVEDHLIVGGDVAPLGTGLCGARHAIDNLAWHLGRVRRAAEAEHRLAFQYVIDGVLGCCIGEDVEGLGCVFCGADGIRGSNGEAHLAFFLSDDGYRLLSEGAALSQMNALGQCPLIAGGMACALGCHGHCLAYQDVALR